MQVLDRASGQYFDFPDHATDQDIINTFEGARQQTQGGSFAPLAQQFMQGMQQPIAQQIAQGPQRSTLPNIGGGAMVGLNPQQAQFVLGQAQQSNVDSMAERMKQQQMVQQGLESEKDRSQQLKLQQTALKNQIAERKMMQEQAKFEAEQRANESSLDRASREKMAAQGNQIDQQRLEQSGQQFSAELGLRQQGLGMEQKRIDLQQKGIEADQAAREQQGWERATIAMENPDTGEVEPTLAWTKRGYKPEPIGPAPVTTKDEQIVRSHEDPRVAEQAAKLRAEIMDDNFRRDVNAPLKEVILESKVGARQMYNLPAFVNDEEVNLWKEMDKRVRLENLKEAMKQSDPNLKEYTPSPEDEKQAEIDSKIAVLEIMNIPYKLVDGEPKMLKRDAQSQASPQPQQPTSGGVNMQGVPSQWQGSGQTIGVSK